jgi:hypothetical protein
MDPLLQVLPGRRLGLLPQKVRTYDGCRRHESDGDQGNGGCPSHSGGFGRGTRRLKLTRRGCRLAPPPPLPPLGFPQHPDQHRPEDSIPSQSISSSAKARLCGYEA